MEEQKVQDTNNDPQTKDEILNPNSCSSSSNSTQQQQQQKESVEEEELKGLLVPDVRDLPLTPTSAVESNFVPYFAPGFFSFFFFLPDFNWSLEQKRKNYKESKP